MDSNPIDEGPLERAGFSKQKRNLLVMSFLLAAGLWAGVSFAPMGEITVFGQKLLLATPERIGYVAWTVWLYFLLRYVGFHLQYQKPEEKFLYYFRRDLHNAYDRLIRAEVLKQGKLPESDYYVGLFSMTFFGASCCIRVKPKTSTTLWEQIEPIKLRISPMATWLARMKVSAKALFGTAFTSEYYLPYVVALLPVVLILIR